MSRLPFELLLALRYLRPKRTFVSIITLISILGVMLGVAVLIIVISVMSGFDKELREKVLGFNAHLKIFTPGRSLANYAQIMNKARANPRVKALAPFIFSQVLVKTEPAQGQAMVMGPWLRGVDPKAEAGVSTIPANIRQGSFDLGNHGLVVGVDFARSLDLQVGDRVAVYSTREFEKWQEAESNSNQVVPVPADFEIRGVFDAGYYEYNSTVILASLDDAQDLLDLGDTVQGLSATLTDPYEASTVARELENTLGPEFRVTTWKEDSPLMMAVMVEKNVMLYILFFIVVVAAFGITCTLITFIVMKTREIGLLKALGATNRQVMWVFLGQSLVVSVFGVIAGLGFGLLAVAYRNQFLGMMRGLTGIELFPESIYGFSQLPALIIPGDIVIICGGSMLICLMAAAFPAWQASRMNPVEALRYE